MKDRAVNGISRDNFTRQNEKDLRAGTYPYQFSSKSKFKKKDFNPLLMNPVVLKLFEDNCPKYFIHPAPIVAP